MDNSSSKQHTKRIFIAIKPTLSPLLIDCYKSLKDKLGEDGINWVPTENMHLTIKFLGDTPEFYFNSIVNSIKVASSAFEEFKLTFKGAGYFGKPDPKVLWIGINENSALNSFQEKLDENLFNLGFEKEKKNFSPHLTICRIKRTISSSLIKEIVFPYEHVHFQEKIIKDILLIESVLRPTGPIYKTIKTISL